jgi:hypothetical protein
MGPIPQERREEVNAPDILTKAGIAMTAFTPMNIFDQALAQVQSQPPIPPPRQYMTPGMTDFAMGEDGAPMNMGAPQFISGAASQAQPAQTLPAPEVMAQRGQGIAPQQNQGTAQTAANPLARPRTTDDVNRRRNEY